LRNRLREKLSSVLLPEALSRVYNSFDIVGDIAIIKTPRGNIANAETVAKQIMSVHKNVKAVFCQASQITGDFRVRKLRLLAGENKTTTTYKESGCTFNVDVERCYFSPRLINERSRIARLVQSGETVVNMFSGVGCFSIIIAKQVPSAKVYSIDINPQAFEFMQQNIQLNHVVSQVTPLLGDAKALIETRLKGCADRVLMPLPEKAIEYLPIAVSALKTSGGWLHVHLFEHALKTEDVKEEAKLKLTDALSSLGVPFEVPFVRVVRDTGPNWYQIVTDVLVE